LLLVFAAILVVAGLFGHVPGDLFLAPIKDLSQGLAALRRAERQVRIPETRDDEFGDLVRAFNRIVEDLTEIELAKVVQESLLPSSFPKFKGYSGTIWTRTASRLGGDYCDVFLLQDGRVLIAVGDVTGHGVGAAFVMAMVKAEMFHFAEQPTKRIEDLLERLDRLLHDLMQRRLLMTFFAGMLDPGTGGVTLGNAGHPFPFIFGLRGPVTECRNPGMSLGFPLRPRIKASATINLEPGTSIVLFTDGLYEALDNRNESFGYEELGNTPHNASRLSPEGIAALMRKTLDRFRGDHELEDDCTIMVIQRDREGAGHR